MSLIHTLERLVGILERRDPTVRHALRSGLPHSVIEATLAPLPLSPPSELFDLYQWHDGIDTSRTAELMLGEHTLLPLDEAVHEYHAIVHYYANPTSPLDRVYCFPFAAFQGSYLALYCHDQPFEGLVHPIIGIFEDVSIAFENLEAMAQTAIAWFDGGIYDTEPVDELLRKAIWWQYNSRIPVRATTY
jgi:hypothetical protein